MEFCKFMRVSTGSYSRSFVFVSAGGVEKEIKLRYRRGGLPVLGAADVVPRGRAGVGPVVSPPQRCFSAREAARKIVFEAQEQCNGKRSCDR